MKKLLFLLISLAVLFSCQQKKSPDGAEQLFEKISSAYEEGNDSACLLLITELRAKYPKAIEERKKALELFQKASERASQKELERTMRSLDSIKATYAAHKRVVDARHQEGIATASELSNLTFERMRRDSLQVRYDVLCSQIRYIHKRQKQLNDNGNDNGNDNNN